MFIENFAIDVQRDNWQTLSVIDTSVDSSIGGVRRLDLLTLSNRLTKIEGSNSNGTKKSYTH